MKYSQWLGIATAVLLVIACFMPWTWYPDLGKHFTGFFTENKIYGRPGRVFIALAAIAIIFFLIPRIWAKRWNLLVCAISFAFAIKSFILFSGCYKGICPEKKAGIWIMLVSSGLMLLFAILPDLPAKKKSA